ncbi:MAG: hypothetical protein HUU55_02100 [Myxococcales bacterium]|nr:hypothetical protein [Myxococcales bacterium]
MSMHCGRVLIRNKVYDWHPTINNSRDKTPTVTVWLGVLAVSTFFTACEDNRTFPTIAGYTAPVAQPLQCVPNLDGVIEATELQAAIGVPVSYLVSAAEQIQPIDTKGLVTSDGKRIWDWSADRATDQIATLSAEVMGQRWFADEFPNGAFIVPFDAGATVESVYQHNADGLWLLGVASSKENPPEGKTLLIYDKPIALFQFPLEVGKNWVSSANIKNGVLRGLPYAGKDIYEVSVDASGELLLPDIAFSQALRVKTRVVVQPAVGQAQERRQVSFVFECFGEVARAVSENGAQEDLFSNATEVRRLGL